jgi:hypothetical protein
MSQPEDLNPEEEQVRRLLADARHAEPMPDDVAARLDAVLADLRDEDHGAPAPVVSTQRPTDLAAARRRRNARSWLVAAAAVGVLGLGINQVVQMDVSGGDDADSSSSDAAVSGVERSGNDNAEGGGSATEAPSTATSPGNLRATLAPVRLDSARFDTQVTRLRDRVDRDPAAYGLADGTDSAPPAGDNLSAHAATCAARGWGRGTAVPVRYDRQPGVLVFRRVGGDTQVVDLFLCGSDHPERSITLPAP